MMVSARLTPEAHRHERGSALTTWAWAQLAEGSYGLPGPAVVASPWVLEARASRPRRLGFTRVTRPEQWGRVRTARNMAADCSLPSKVLVISAEHPAEVERPTASAMPTCRHAVEIAQG